MAAEAADRLQVELQLLESMYPTQVTFDSKSRELRYHEETAHLVVRLPAGYLSDEIPQIIEARIGRDDVRDKVVQVLSDREPVGEEILDWILLSFQELSAAGTATAAEAAGVPVDHAADQTMTATGSSDPNHPASAADATAAAAPAKTTVIIWLHHLLNTAKRKQALSPASPAVAGVSKPGYPGVLLYTGPKPDVDAHVHALKQLQWQAFQVRMACDGEEGWSLAHGAGVIEVEAMKDVVAEVGEAHKAEFMAAMRMA